MEMHISAPSKSAWTSFKQLDQLYESISSLPAIAQVCNILTLAGLGVEAVEDGLALLMIAQTFGIELCF